MRRPHPYRCPGPPSFLPPPLRPGLALAASGLSARERCLYDATSHKQSYTGGMSTISFRPTEEDRRNLAALGTTPTEAIRRALRVAAAAAREEQLRAEAKALAADPDDRAEVAQVREFVGDTWDEIQ